MCFLTVIKLLLPVKVYCLYNMYSVTAQNSLQDPRVYHCIISDIWPLIRFGQVCCCFPFSIQKQAPHISKFSPFLFAYSIVVYTFSSYSTFLALQNMSTIYNEENLQNKVSKGLFFGYGTFTILIGLSCWCHSHLLTKCLQEWCQFQLDCKHCTHQLLTWR